VAITAGDSTTDTLRAVHFPVDPTRGWAVGDNGRIVMITGNVTDPTPANPNSGDEWWSWSRTNQPSGTTANLYAIDMVDTSIGYAVGEGGVVLKTVNGGASWFSPLANGRGRSQHLNAIDFLNDAARGLAVGQASATPDATLLRTMDAGATWTLHNTGVPTTQNLVAVALPRTGSGSVGYALSTSALYRNPDVFGAGTWSAVGNLPAGTWRAILAPAGDGTLVLAGDGGKVAVTTTGTNASPAWIPQTVPSGTPDLTCLHAVVDLSSITQLAIFAGGKGGILWRTPLDGTWTQATLNTALAADILSLGGALGGMPGAQIFAGASDGKIHRLSEVTQVPLVYAREELPVPSGAGTPISVAFPTPFLGWWLAGNGIWTTENANATPVGTVAWSKSAVHLTPVAVAPVTPLLGKSATLLRGLWMHSGGVNGYAVGETGTILRTFTGGK